MSSAALKTTTSTATHTAITIYDEKSSNVSSSTSNSNEIMLDSLPYIDNLHPDYEAYALTLIEEEMQNMGEPQSEENLLRHLPNPFGLSGTADSTPASLMGSSLNRTEYEHLVARQGQPRNETIDFREKMRSIEPLDKNNEEEWKDALKKAKTELEYERLRMVNAELQSEYESSLWQYQTKMLEIVSKNVKSNLSQQQVKVDQINARRKDMQTVKAAPKLHILSQKWDEGLNRVKVLSDGVKKLNSEVEELRKVTGASFQNEDKSNENDDDL